MSDDAYGWLIVFACFYNNFALFGIFRSAGIFYVAFIQEYGITRQEAAWPFSLCGALFQIIAPLGSILAQYTTIRKVAITGAIIATCGIVCCFFADGIWWINLSYGIIHGIGFGLVVQWTAVVINFHFVRHRATAMGISFSGAPISSFLFPSLMEYLLHEYGIQGSFLILAGIVMNVIVSCTFLKLPEAQRTHKSNLTTQSNNTVADTDQTAQIKLTNSETTQTDPITKNDTVENVSHDLKDQICLKECTDKPSDSQAEEHKSLIENNSNVITVVKGSDKEICDKDHIITKNNRSSTKKMDEIRNALTFFAKLPAFYLILLSTIIFFLGVHSLFVTIVDYAQDKGIPENQAFHLLSFIAITDLIGRTCLGWITDKKYVRTKTMFLAELFTTGILFFFYPVINSHVWLTVICLVHGIAIGGAITLLFVFQAEVFGLEKQTYYIGIASFFGSFSTFLRPPMIGLFRDTIGTYDWMYIFLAILYMIMCAAWLIESCWTRKSNSIVVTDYHQTTEQLKVPA